MKTTAVGQGANLLHHRLAVGGGCPEGNTYRWWCLGGWVELCYRVAHVMHAEQRGPGAWFRRSPFVPQPHAVEVVVVADVLSPADEVFEIVAEA